MMLSVAALVVACAVPPAAQDSVEPLPPPTEEGAPPVEPTAAEIAPEQQPVENIAEGCVDQYTQGVDYFPHKVTVEYSTSFTVEYFDSYKVVNVLHPWPGAEESFRYVLVQCGTPAPDDLGGATVIQVPAGSIVAMSTSYITHLDDLGLLDRLVGMDSGAYVTNPEVRARLAAGDIVEIAPLGQPNVEAALDLDPSLIMAFSAGIPEYDSHPALAQAGLPVVINADWMEQDPLARAEWVKFMAVFYNREAEAEAIFGETASQYQAAAALAAGVVERPTVFTDTPFEGTWYVPGGLSITARLLADAGADYLWADDDSTGTLFLDFETVFDQAQDADFWVNVWGPGSKAEMLTIDPRFADFEAFQTGNLYSFDARGTEVSTEIWETGVAHPDVWLLDLIKIFHPELVPDHELYYYRPLPES